jgi:hypothetical protein
MHMGYYSHQSTLFTQSDGHKEGVGTLPVTLQLTFVPQACLTTSRRDMELGSDAAGKYFRLSYTVSI